MAERSIDLKVKRIARVMYLAGLAALVVLIALPSASLWHRILFTAFVATAALSYRRDARVHEDWLDVRGLRKTRSVDLSRLKAVYFGRWRDRRLALELWVTDQDNRTVVLTVRWWAGWRALLLAIHEHLAEDDSIKCSTRSRERIVRLSAEQDSAAERAPSRPRAT